MGDEFCIKNSYVFDSADILIAREELLPLWSVNACDQFTSEPEYWREVDRLVGENASSLRLILPEAMLGAIDEEREIADINARMKSYLESGLFREFPDSMVYVRRKMLSGLTRRGIVGAVDLTQYDYQSDSRPKIRATEQTVLERIPPRVKIRKDAPLELPHVLLLADDRKNAVFNALDERLSSLRKLYDFELMKNGGHIEGYLLTGELIDFVRESVSSLEYSGMQLAVGDGNHSLASAKACFEALRLELGDERAMAHPARYALAELVDIEDAAIVFEPIHRYICGVDVSDLLKYLACAGGGDFCVPYTAGGMAGEIMIPNRGSSLACGALQSLLDEYLKEFGGKIDYIHGEKTAEKLAQNDGVSFLLPPLDKSSLFKTVVSDGVLPRKAFSMGHAEEKRYYLEARIIR